MHAYKSSMASVRSSARSLPYYWEIISKNSDHIVQNTEPQHLMLSLHTCQREGVEALLDNLAHAKLLEDEGGGVCLGATPCGSQAYPYLLLVQVIHVVR
jgi:hypothetical protein